MTRPLLIRQIEELLTVNVTVKPEDAEYVRFWPASVEVMDEGWVKEMVCVNSAGESVYEAVVLALL